MHRRPTSPFSVSMLPDVRTGAFSVSPAGCFRVPRTTADSARFDDLRSSLDALPPRMLIPLAKAERMLPRCGAGDLMTLLDGVSRILAAIPAITAEAARLDAKHGIDSAEGFRLGDAPTMMRMLETNQEEGALNVFLSAVPYETLLKLVALMYFGRDQDKGFPEQLDGWRRRGRARPDLIRAILEKVPACGRYFSDGVGRLLEEGVGINEL